jgi:Uma2 family endonuclease
VKKGDSMATALETKAHRLSLEAFLELPETKPASEYIDAQIYQKPMPQGKHSTLQAEMVMAINQKAKPKKLAYTFPELRCTFGKQSIVPDIAMFEWNHIPLDADSEALNKIQFAPDWMIEILSPAQSPFLIIDKLGFALKYGTKLGWLIVPQERTVLTFQGDRFNSYRGKDILPMLEIFSDWQISVQDVFDLLKF